MTPARLLLTLHHAQNPYVEVQTTPEWLPRYRECEPSPHPPLLLATTTKLQVQVLEDYSKQMRDAENESHEGKRRTESLWPIMRISHSRSRYIYELYYRQEGITKELYDWLLKEGYADAK